MRNVCKYWSRLRRTAFSLARSRVDTLIGNGAVKVSGGKKNAFPLQRALLPHPQLLVFDEPLFARLLTEEEISRTIREVLRIRRRSHPDRAPAFDDQAADASSCWNAAHRGFGGHAECSTEGAVLRYVRQQVGERRRFGKVVLRGCASGLTSCS